MLRMCEEHVPPELNKMTQKDIAFVADFLSEHFSENEELFDRKGKYFNVERVGQYLKDEDEDLMSPPNTQGNQWLKFLEESTHLKESPLLFPSYPQKSLHFVKRMMESVIQHCLQKPAEVIGKSVKQAAFVPLYTVPESSENTPRLFELPSLWNDKKAKMHNVVFCMPEVSPSKLYLLRIETRSNSHAPHSVVSINLHHLIENPEDDDAADQSSYLYSCLDARFYDDEVLTVVLRGREEQSDWRVLAQLPLSSSLSGGTDFSWQPDVRLDQQSSSIPCQTPVLGNQWRKLDNMKAQFVAVNGIRKVACVLSSNVRHIRVFEMDVEDEDDEGLDSQNASADQDGLETSGTSHGPGEENLETDGNTKKEEGGALHKEEEHLESEEALEVP
ncbi:Anaphase-promoting complex subunit 4 [Oryzias melastigma]|uniref:Anaphase-promoting complex subunit 4 n=1 Tax=Oryzias melastigma TaxID=30732 RepID=A0A834BVV0_ORYME|nr:Anaphase-promoting complex subunit 4 [Oryzias melastigma]